MCAYPGYVFTTEQKIRIHWYYLSFNRKQFSWIPKMYCPITNGLYNLQRFSVAQSWLKKMFVLYAELRN